MCGLRAMLRAMDAQAHNPDGLVRTSVSVPRSLLDEMRALAKATDRPLSGEVRRAFRHHVEANREPAAS